MKTIDRLSILISSVGYFLVYILYCILVFNPFNLDIYIPPNERTLPSDVPFAYLRETFLGLMILLIIVSSGVSVIRFNSNFFEYIFNLVKNCCSIVISFAFFVILLCILGFSLGSFEDGIDGLFSTIRYFYNWVLIPIVLLSVMVSIVGLVITGVCKVIEKISKKQRRLTYNENYR